MSDLIVRDVDAVRVLSLNRPASKNGLTFELNRELTETLDGAQADRAVRCVLLTGEGGAFCSGLDLKVAAAMGPGGDVGAHVDSFHGVIRAVRRVDKPVVALVDGPAVGFGCDLALACDLRLGTPRARFGEIFVHRGLMPDGGGTFSLPRIVGVAKALELMMTGDVVAADEALRLGLVSRIVALEGAMEEALALGHRLAAGAPLVHARVKRAVYDGLGTLEDALARERAGQVDLARSKDFFEGVNAFFAKRPPKFTGE